MLLPFNLRLRAIAHCAAGGDAVAARSLVDDLIGESASSALSDDALVSRAVALINRSLDGPITLAAVAKAVHRSPSRIAHRFREATGVPLRRYVLWSRLRTAAEAAMRGASLTEAAAYVGTARADGTRDFPMISHMRSPTLLQWTLLPIRCDMPMGSQERARCQAMLDNALLNRKNEHSHAQQARSNRIPLASAAVLLFSYDCYAIVSG